MRVLHINTVAERTSTAKISRLIHEYLLDDGQESIFCYGRGRKIEEDSMFFFGSNIGVNTHALLTRVLGVTGVFSNYSTTKLIRYIESYEPDIVHLHNLHGYYVNLYRVVKYLKRKDIKTVWTFHDDYMFTGMCAGYYECNEWKNGCKTCKNIKEYPKSIFFKFTANQYKWKEKMFIDFNNLIIITPSYWLANQCKTSFLKEKSIKVINNGIDTTDIYYARESNEVEEVKRRYEITSEKIILSVIPDFSNKRKGGEDVLKLAESLMQMGRKDIKIIIVGIKNKIQNIPDNIIQVGRIENPRELAKYYSLANVFLITSKGENFPTVCLEALACNTPVIGYKLGGIKEMVNIGDVNLVEYGNIEKLVDRVVDIIGRDDTYKEIDKYKLSKEYMIEKYLEIYSREK